MGVRGKWESQICVTWRCDLDTIVYLIRHGLTSWSKEDYFSGVSDIPLLPEGLDQARSLAKRFVENSKAFDAIISSPLQRCRQTAQILSESLTAPIQIVDSLSELDYGDWEGMNRLDVMEQYPGEYEQWRQDPYLLSPPNGESGKQLIDRVIPSLKTIVKANNGSAIAIVAHKTVNRLIICWALGIPFKKYRQKIIQYPACVNTMKFSSRGMATVISLNDITHYYQGLKISSDG